jgi:purine-nucleoside phosphorylase
MDKHSQRIKDAVDYIKERIDTPLKIGLVLGSGLGMVTENVANKRTIQYWDIPGFPHSNVEGHRGELISGKYGGKDILIFSGRYHYYQGHSLRDVTLPVRVAKRLGVKTLVLTNASGGINPRLTPGDIMLINDHINYMGNNPLIGEDPDVFGPVFIDMTEPYDHALIKKVKEMASANPKIGKVQEGIYIATSGPSYETKAEIKFFKKIGADAVGMSTVPEVIVATHEGMKVIGIAIITNMACGITKKKLEHSDVLKIMDKVSTRVIILLSKIIESL